VLLPRIRHRKEERPLDWKISAYFRPGLLMQKYILIAFVAVLSFFDGWGQSHGLQFSSHEVVQEKRTSLILTSKRQVCFKDEAEISFDLNFRPGLETYFGYIIRLITADGQNIDVVYNQRFLNFNFVIGESYNGVFEIDQKALTSQWIRVKIMLDSKTRQAALYVNDVLKSRGRANIAAQTCMDIIFGTSDKEGFQTVDIPPMRVKDVRIVENSNLKYEWRLSESSGIQAVDHVSQTTAMVKNPVWIKPRHQVWQPLHSFEVKGAASVAFDSRDEILYVVSVDSLYSIFINNGAIAEKRLAKSRETLLPGNQSIFDTQFNKLFNFYFDERVVSVYDTVTNTWSDNFRPALLTEYWHANNFISSVDTSLYIVGGYGQLRYKNGIWRYHIPSGNWDSIETKGDFFMPRYLAALGTNINRDTAFIIGGYGSNSGNQAVNPKYNYELLLFSVKDHTIKQIYALKEPDQQFCFVNSLVIDTATDDFYSLVYPTNRFNSRLQLFKGSLSSPEYKIFGDTLPYSFHDIESFANIFYSPISKKLIAVTLFTSKENVTAFKSYTIDFPPNDLDIAPSQTDITERNLLMLIVAAFACFGFVYYISTLRRVWKVPPAPGKTPVMPVEAHQPLIIRTTEVRPGVFLFGQFHANDSHGEDITKLFTPLLKELFLLIIIYTIRNGKGISSEALNEILWHDKSEKDAKNNRSVNLAKLKTIIEKIGDCVIVKEAGFWQFQNNDPDVYVDYQYYVGLQSQKPVIDREYILKLLHLTQHGSFLAQTEYSWLDDIKADISNTIINQCTQYIEKTSIAEEAELVVEICTCIFMFDRLNEQALEFKCKSLIHLKRHALANTAYLKFTKEYREIYQEDFPRSFNEIIK
jgi:DNA-binding SARP family transcriptional activator